MDAVKFVKEYLRMCTKVDECEDCPVYKTDFCTVPAKERSQESAEEIVELVEQWAAAPTEVAIEILETALAVEEEKGGAG